MTDPYVGDSEWLAFVLRAPFLGFLAPLLCYFADRLDRDRNFTLGYICEAERQ